MITEKQFLEACDIIKEYQIQINSLVKNTLTSELTKTDFMEWAKNTDISVRLYSGIKFNYERGFIKYVEDVKTRKQFLKNRFLGKKSCDEFFNIINKETK